VTRVGAAATLARGRAAARPGKPSAVSHVPLIAATPEWAEYLPVLVMLLFAFSFAALNLGLSWVLGRKAAPNPVKDAAYECGMPPVTDAHQRFSVKFYLVAILFVLFDIEVVFLYPWAVHFKQQSAFLFAEMAVFLGILFLGWWYVIRKGAVSWSKE
jgi:NADH-quinone oxidoreductase subunit A